MSNMERLWIVSTYNQDPSSVINRLDGRYIICNQGDPSFVPVIHREGACFIQSPHTGHNISDYLSYIVDNYENLPDVLGFIKGNVFPRHISEDVFVARSCLEGFVPIYSDDSAYVPHMHRFIPFKLLAQQVAPGYYLEIANDWYVKHRKVGRYFPRLRDLFIEFFKREPPNYITFVPGACMQVPSSNIRRWPLDVYQRLHEAVTYDFFPVEAFHLERSMLYFFEYPPV
jgi:hypothetical protein